jgi:hypothetical protein
LKYTPPPPPVALQPVRLPKLTEARVLRNDSAPPLAPAPPLTSTLRSTTRSAPSAAIAGRVPAREIVTSRIDSRAPAPDTLNSASPPLPLPAATVSSGALTRAQPPARRMLRRPVTLSVSPLQS